MNPSLQNRLQTFRNRLQTNSAIATPLWDGLPEYYQHEIREMEIQLHQENSVFSLIKRNVVARRETRELYTDSLDEYLNIVRTHDVLESDRRWSWKHLEFVHYVRYK